MATNIQGSSARNFHKQVVHYLRRTVTHADDGAAVTVGVLPAGALVTGGGVKVTTAFNGSTTDLLDVGTAAAGDLFASDLDVSTTGLKALDDLDAETGALVAADTVVTATYADGGGDATAGSAVVWIEFILDNDG